MSESENQKYLTQEKKSDGSFPGATGLFLGLCLVGLGIAFNYLDYTSIGKAIVHLGVFQCLVPGISFTAEVFSRYKKR